MRLRKNAARAAAFLLTGALAAVMVFAVGNNINDETTAVAGTWEDYVSTAWVNPDDARYRNYEVEPGSAEDAPYLIQTAEEFSGIRAFEGGEDLVGKYLMLVNDIDLSAHYWDPIELRGRESFSDDLMPDENEVVHFDGNSRKISGMNIQSVYGKVLVEGDYIGATGLFSYVYKARLANFRLNDPVINLTKTSGIWWQEVGAGELRVNDIVGSVVGISRSSHVADVHVDGLELNYRAVFGEYLNGECAANQNLEPGGEYDCDTYFSPDLIAVGGVVGVSYGHNVVRDVSVKNSTVDVKPNVGETDDKRMGVFDRGSSSGVIVGGIVGYNINSMVLNACSNADVVFSDDGYRLRERVEIPDMDGYVTSFGGLVGASILDGGDGWVIRGCVYNSCSHSKLSIDIDEIILNTTVAGGLVGILGGGSMVNNYFDGEIITSGNVVGEIAGMAQGDQNNLLALAANYYLEGKKPYGISSAVAADAALTKISTVERLVDDLNVGRALVAADILRYADLPKEIVDANITTWEVRDGSFPLDCVGYRTAGLMFSDRRVEVPNTGVGRR